MSKQVSRRSFWLVALGACLLAAPLGAGCSRGPEVDPTIKVEQGKTAEESVSGRGRAAAGKTAEPATRQRVNKGLN
jgi:hypothetical protein